MAVDTIYLKNEQGVDVPYQLGADSRNVTYSPNAETVEGSVHKELQQNNIHKNTIIANSAGVHGLRYTDNKLQVQAPGGSWTPIESGDMKKEDYDDPTQNGVIAIAHGGTGNTSGYVRAGAVPGSTVGQYATAEGSATKAEGKNSHAGGFMCYAIGDYSHASGYRSVSDGECSFVFGDNCKSGTAGDYSGTLGWFVQNDGKYSLVVGYGDQVHSGHTPVLDQDCYTRVKNDCGITLINQNKNKLGLNDLAVVFSLAAKENSPVGESIVDGTQGAYVEMRDGSFSTHTITIAPYSINFLTISSQDNASAVSPGTASIGKAVYLIIGSTNETSAPTITPILENGKIPSVTPGVNNSQIDLSVISPDNERLSDVDSILQMIRIA